MWILKRTKSQIEFSRNVPEFQLPHSDAIFSSFVFISHFILSSLLIGSPLIYSICPFHSHFFNSSFILLLLPASSLTPFSWLLVLLFAFTFPHSSSFFPSFSCIFLSISQTSYFHFPFCLTVFLVSSPSVSHSFLYSIQFLIILTAIFAAVTCLAVHSW